MADPVVAVWLVDVASIPDIVWPRLEAVLDGGERSRATKFVFERHRRQHVAAHALKRLMLSRFGSLAPSDWTFETAPGGKPRLRGPGKLRFSLTHCDGLAACALSEDCEPGIDAEPADREIVSDGAPGVFSPEEQAWLRTLPASERRSAFLRLWTLKEAYGKAVGTGLARGLADITFTLVPLRARFTQTGQDLPGWRFEQRAVGRHLIALSWRDVAAAAAAAMVETVDFERLLAADRG